MNISVVSQPLYTACSRYWEIGKDSTIVLATRKFFHIIDRLLYTGVHRLSQHWRPQPESSRLQRAWYHQQQRQQSIHIERCFLVGCTTTTSCRMCTSDRVHWEDSTLHSGCCHRRGGGAKNSKAWNEINTVHVQKPEYFYFSSKGPVFLKLVKYQIKGGKFYYRTVEKFILWTSYFAMSF